MKANIVAVGLAHPFEVGYSEAGKLLDETVKTIIKQGCDCANVNVVMHDFNTVKEAVAQIKNLDADALLICIATWSEDHHLLDLLSYVDKPVILRAYPAKDTGSLCCAHQIGAVFTDIGKNYEFVYGEADSEACAKKAIKIATAYALANNMNKVKMGTIGGRVKGMTEIAYDEFSIKEKLGARIINIQESEMLKRVNELTDEEAQKILDSKKDTLAPCRVLSSKESMIESIKYYGALKGLCEEYDLDALSVSCYTTYMGKVCLGYSLLAEEGIVASCEGDVTSALTMKLLYELSGQPVNNTDYLYHDEEKNTILFGHCGSSGFSIAGSEIELAPVRLAESGVCSRFVPKTGTVTLVNICGHGEKFRMAVMVGEATACGMEFPGNPSVVRFEKKVEEINEEIMKNGIGHHWMIGYGDFREELARFCKIKGIKHYEI